jgi:methionyl-tRNA formyltransferase
MRLVFFGTPHFAVPTLQTLIDRPDVEVVAVVTQPDKRRGRGNQLDPSPVKQVAVAAGIDVWQPTRVKRDAATLAQLRDAQADAFVVVAYGQILSQEILDMPCLGCINGHGSLLPEYRGAAPIQWCLHDGAIETGITTMLMDAGMDTGAMLLKRSRPIALLDDAWTLAAGLAEDTAALMVETLHGLDRGDLTPEPQDNDRATYASLIQKDDYQLDWTQSAIALHNKIRGFYPNCMTTFRGQPLKIKATAPIGQAWRDQLPAELAAIAPDLPNNFKPGQIAMVVKTIGPIVMTGDGLLLLREVQLAGKKAALGWDFANGMRLEVGEMIGL